MNPRLIALLFLTAAHPGGSSCGSGGCAHTSGSAPAHVSATSAHFNGSAGHHVEPVAGHAVQAVGSLGAAGASAGSHGAAAATPFFRSHDAPVGGGFHLSLDPIVDTLADVGQAVLDLAGNALGAGDSDAPPPPVPAGAVCTSVRDCGDGQQGHGAVCDRLSQGGRGDADDPGICREACRTPADCDGLAECLPGLDPMDPTWRGCVPR